MAQTLRSVIYSLCAGLIVVYYSETMFWGGLRRALDPLDLCFTLLVYSLVFYAIRQLAIRFRAATTADWMLLGAIYGWLVEGVIVQTTYEALPLTISWTALAWHAPFSVVVGWVLMRRWLHSSWRSALLATAAIGIFQGIWSLNWWQETLSDPGAAIASIDEVILYNFVFGLTLIIGYLGVDHLGVEERFNRWGVGIAIGALAAWFALIAVPNTPIAVLILPACLLPTLFVLRRNRHVPTPDMPAQSIPVIRYVALLLIPLIASAVYGLFVGTRLELQSLFGVVLIPLGFLLLVVSAWHLWRKGHQGVRPTTPLPES